ncbi:probable NAD kinase 1 isoform X4 [Carya illinoinensis]|uniref:probable NAD kinase 1 isoform X4 n=1 Tax=Carya illinoinensis TaxID=32201 RepID=UPI001C7272ED|nr:probable NAD kinase 1 isoform X4 [Carya illinoinensis]
MHMPKINRHKTRERERRRGGAIVSYHVWGISEHGIDVDYARMGNLVNQPVWCSEANEQFGKCCGRNGLCSHEVLQDGETDFDSKMVRMASFELSWCCKGEQSDQHKHYIVSFERGNIITAERSSKQISLRWKSHPQIVLILTKPNSISVQVLCRNGQVPGILICPHSLSFRPLILTEHVTLRVQVPFNSRGHAWASFDGKDGKQLTAGNALVCSMAPWPVPTACLVDSTSRRKRPL